MENIIHKRLVLMGDKVIEGIAMCQEILNRKQRGEHPTDNDETKVEKLKTAMSRLNKEIQCYSYQHQGPSSEDTCELLEELTSVNIKADDILVELDQNRERGGVGQPQPLLLGEAPYSNPVGTTSRLPQLNLPTFDGNHLDWHEFWGKFTASIERRTDLSDIDKLTYLQDCLQGSAKELIAGLTTTNETYKIAVDTLKEEFGEVGIIIDAHYNALFTIPSASQDIKDNKRVLNDIEKHLRVLDALGEDTGHNNAIRGLIVNKFSAEVQSNLRMKITPTRENVNTIIHTLKLIIKALDNSSSRSTPNAAPPSGFTTEALYSQYKLSKPNGHGEGIKKRKQQFGDKQDYKRQKLNHRDYTHKNHVKPASQQNIDSSKKRSKLQCIFCNGGHIHENCREVKTLDERKAKLKGRCYLCLRDNHSVRECKTQMPACVHCGKERHHNRALCPTRCHKEESSINTVTLFSHNDYDTILQTAIASIDIGNQEPLQAKLLFDCGSQKSYILSKLVKKLNLQVWEETCLTVFTFGSTTPKLIDTKLVKVPIQLNGYKIDIMAYAVPSTTGPLPSHQDFKLRLRKDFPELDWAKDTAKDTAADIIIGNDYYHKFVMSDRKEIADNLHLIKTGLGWIPSGIFRASGAHQLAVLTYVNGGCICKGNDLFFLPDPAIRDNSITMLWELEAVGITDSPKVLQDEEVINFFNKTTQFVDNRYQVKWPWVEYPPILPRNFGLAYGRLQSLLKRLEPEHLNRYNEVLIEQREKGIIEEVMNPASPQPHPVHYLPHHCVIQEHKSTQLRIVYDASAKLKGQCSLNELLYKGPLMLTNLTTLLLNFRRYPIGLIADVEKAFLQIGLQHADRDVTRFLWLRDINRPPTNDNLIHLRFCRVPFGIISSPFLLAATIQYHLNSTSDATAHTVASSLYVDNLVTGANTRQEARQLYNTATASLGELSMNLRGWNSNDKLFVQQLPTAHQDQDVHLTVLGLKWDTNSDVLRLAFEEPKLDTHMTTKREVLRVIASVYDPCGFVAPLTIPARTFLQDLWAKGLKWDTPFSSDLKAAWDTCVMYLRGVTKFSIPRQYYPSVNLVGKPLELHCFTDASLDAYVAVIYLRITSLETHFVKFVMSKSRVTPLQRKPTLTIPKLELLAVVIGTRLLTYVKNALDLQPSDSFLWTDNQAVLGWLRTERLLPPWVSRRVGEAHKANNVRFRYVPSDLNPADLATRPLKQNVIPACWVDGPAFLRQSSTLWPFDNSVYTPGADTETIIQSQYQKPTEALNTQVATIPRVTTDEQDLPKHGSQLPLFVILQLQKVHFKDEVAKKQTNLSRALGLFVDDKSVVRCKGRYQNAALPYEQRCPILLPTNSDLTNWVIERVHKENYHVGVSHTLALVRRYYWIPQGRNAVAKVIRRCPQCVKYGGGPYRLPAMPALPIERISYSHPFTYTGVDYMGPLLVHENGSTQKRWVCLYTCMAVRAVHLEVVGNLSAEEFILGLRRFISTRGAPTLLLSDNAAHFKTVAQILAAPEIRPHHIEWKFITELSPWQGGLYERLIGLVKHCLQRTIDKSLLRDTQLATVVKEIEGVLNTRPLTTVGTDNDFVLTPSCFLQSSGPLLLQPPHHTDQFHTDLQRRVVDGWKRTNILRQEFQKMFSTQYLLSLRERHTPTIKQPRVLSYKTPQVGDIVQIKGDTHNRALWTVGRISALRPGMDEQVRAAQVTLKDGKTLNRSIGHLYPLELDVSYLEHSRSADSRPDTPAIPENQPRPAIIPPSTCTLPADEAPLPTNCSPSLEGAPDNRAQIRTQRQSAHRARQQIRQWVAAMLALASSTLSRIHFSSTR